MDLQEMIAEVRRLAAEKNASGLPKPARWVALYRMWSESKPTICLWCGGAAAKAPGGKANHGTDCPAMDAIAVEERGDRFRDLAVALADEVARLRAETDALRASRDAAAKVIEAAREMRQRHDAQCGPGYDGFCDLCAAVRALDGAA